MQKAVQQSKPNAVDLVGGSTALHKEVDSTMLIGIIIGLVIGFVIGVKTPSIRLFISYLRKGGMG